MYFVSKIILVYCEKKLFKWLRETFAKCQAEGKEFGKCLRSNSEMTEQFLEWNTFFKFVTGGFSGLISTFEQLKFQFEQIIEM